jgi:hypothetical protein
VTTELEANLAAAATAPIDGSSGRLLHSDGVALAAAAADEWPAQRPKHKHEPSLDAASAGAAAGASSSSSHRPSTFVRLPIDVASLVMSYLDAPSFFSALRSCKLLYGARLKKSAWPSFDVKQFIRRLRHEDSLDHPLPRQLRVLMEEEWEGQRSMRTQPATMPLTVMLHSFAATSTRSSGSTHDAAAAVASPTNGSTAASAAAAATTPLAHSPPAVLPDARMWRYVSEVVPINALSSNSPTSLPFISMLTDVLASSTALPNMRSLRLSSWNPREEEADAVVHTLYSAVAGRLQALSLSDCSAPFVSVSALPLLSSSLRVLVFDNIRDPSALLPLTLLEYLHLNSCRLACADDIQLSSVLRHLSSAHALRSLSLYRTHASLSEFRWLCVLLAVTPALRPRLLKRCTAADVTASATAGFGDPANLIPPLADYVDEARPSRLTEVRFGEHGYFDVWQAEALLLLPSLTRLHSGPRGWFPRLPENPTLPADALANMQQLSLTLVPHKNVFDFSHLFACRRLRVLRVNHNHETEGVSLLSLIQLLQNNAATLEELCFSARTLMQEDSPSAAVAAANSAAPDAPVPLLQLAEAFAQCARLREVELPQYVGLLAVLSHAPALQTLRLHCKANFLSTAVALNLPLCMTASASWCSTHLYLADNEPTATLRDAAALERIWPAGSLAHANPAAIRRLRLFVHCETLSKHQRMSVSRAFSLHTTREVAGATNASRMTTRSSGQATLNLHWHCEYMEQ